MFNYSIRLLYKAVFLQLKKYLQNTALFVVLGNGDV